MTASAVINSGGRGFSRAYRIRNEVFNAVTHGIAAGLAIVGLVLLLAKGVQLQSALHVAAYAVYGSTLVLLFLMSTLYHSLALTKAHKVFQVFDHSSIYLLIAGSYTPYCLLAIEGVFGLVILCAIWASALTGVIYTSCTLHKKVKDSKISTILYVIMGWGCIVAAVPLFQSLGASGFALMLASGVAYTIGSVFYSKKNVRYMHVVWHFFVLAGALLMFFSIYLFTS